MKTLLTFCAAALAGTAAMAQEATYYNFQDLKALDLDDDMVAVHGTVTGVSPNGEWAVGSDWELTCHSWIWKADGSYALTARPAAENLVLDIADDGTAVGSFYDATDDMVYPGYRTPDGEWHRLPQPSYAQTMNQNWKKGQYNEVQLPYIPTAYFISGDGKHIGGWTYAAGGKGDARPGFDAKLHGFFWHLNEAGEYILEELADIDLSATQQGFRPYAMNEEGTILVGLADSDRNGIIQPAAIIDGQLRILIEAPDCDYGEAFYHGVFQGSCFAVSGRNIFGYGDYEKGTSDDDYIYITEQEHYSFRYNADTQTFDKAPGVYVKIANSDGLALGIDGETYDLCVLNQDFEVARTFEYPGTLTDILSASEDFSVIGALSQFSTDYGPLSFPVLLQYDESPVTGIAAPTVTPLAPATPACDLTGRSIGARTWSMPSVTIQNGRKVIK